MKKKQITKRQYKKDDGDCEGSVLTVQEQGQKETKKRSLIEPSAVPASIVTLFVTISMSGIFSFLSAFGLAREIGNIGMFFTVYAGAILLVRYIYGQTISIHQ